MGFKCGIVGLPNVGKSTLFNALTNSSIAQAENFPFCTIEPNVGNVPVQDDRLDKLSEISKSKKKIYTSISFIDIAGLVKGASKGEGLGNKFLSHIREVDAIIHMIRCFESDDIQNVNKNVDPIRDLEIIETEMKLADIESIEKRLEKRNKNKNSDLQNEILKNTLEGINNNKNLLEILKKYDQKEIKMTGLLSLKPKLYVCNVEEENISKGNTHTKSFISLKDDEKNSFMELLKIKNTGLNSLIKKGYNLLELETFFTSGPEESRAWTIQKNCIAPDAAGVIHSDFKKGFIRAETISFEDFVNLSGWQECRNKGKMRLEGKDYIVKDGDILNFRFNT